MPIETPPVVTEDTIAKKIATAEAAETITARDAQFLRSYLAASIAEIHKSESSDPEALFLALKKRIEEIITTTILNTVADIRSGLQVHEITRIEARRIESIANFPERFFEAGGIDICRKIITDAICAGVLTVSETQQLRDVASLSVILRLQKYREKCFTRR